MPISICSHGSRSSLYSSPFQVPKLIPYIVPCFPPLAILIASDIDRMIERGKWHGKALASSIVFGVLFSAALIVYSFVGGRVDPYEALPVALAISAGLLAWTGNCTLYDKKWRPDFLRKGCGGTLHICSGIHRCTLRNIRNDGTFPLHQKASPK